jgi:hypothetical protein
MIIYFITQSTPYVCPVVGSDMVADFAEQSLFALLLVSLITVVNDIDGSVTDVQTQLWSFLHDVANAIENNVINKGNNIFLIIMIY